MADPTQLSDEELLRLSARGDESAFATLYHRRQAAVYRFALHMSGREDVAQEVTQEVFLTLIRDPGRFDAGRGALGSFLFGIARNHVLRHIERCRDHVPMPEDDSEAPAEGDVLANLSREQTIDAVRQAVLTLPAVYREAVVLCDLEELSYADASQALNVPLGTVRSRLNRGRALLAEKLRWIRPGRSTLGCGA